VVLTVEWQIVLKKERWIGFWRGMVVVKGQDVSAIILMFCILSRSFNGGVIYNAILPSSGGTNVVIVHSTKTKIDSSDTGKF
jgi:hypothetical protein